MIFIDILDWFFEGIIAMVAILSNDLFCAWLSIQGLTVKGFNDYTNPRQVDKFFSKIKD